MKKKKNTKKKKGFTLIELLVVIAIIGLLATLAVVSMGSARAKARDAKRISDVKQMSTILDVEDAASPNATINGACNIGTAATGDANVKLCTGPGDVSNFSSFTDPSGTATLCASGVSGNCQYSISANVIGTGVSHTGNYEICFAIENNVQGVGAGPALYSIKAGGTTTAGCL